MLKHESTLILVDIDIGRYIHTNPTYEVSKSLSLHKEMNENNIKFLLAQINETHNFAYLVGLPNQPEPQKCYNDRVYRATKFINESTYITIQ